MIITRSWLEEFIDISNISDEKLCEIFNSIGLEVDSYKKYKMPKRVVVGKILSCNKHPNADKLNVCQVDVGSEMLQIVCGASNVVDAKFVAVALIGANLPDGLEIKPATLRGEASSGMICSSTELGLPKMGDGIWILDESLGAMVPGEPLENFKLINDSIIELELTANRGDCLSIRGVARDLSAVVKRPLHSLEYRPKNITKRGIARVIDLHTKGKIDADIIYALADSEAITSSALIDLRLAFIDKYTKESIDSILKYVTHSSGVIMRAYDVAKIRQDEDRAPINIIETTPGLVEIKAIEEPISIVGVWQNSKFKATSNSKEIIFEASYIEPDILIPAVSKKKIESDDLYYISSRGSEPDLKLGMTNLFYLCDKNGECSFSETEIHIEAKREKYTLRIDMDKLEAIIGQELPAKEVYQILDHLGFKVQKITSRSFGVTIPRWRHDIVNIQDIAEEVLRILGINSIEPRPLELIEANRLTKSAKLYKIKRDIRERAIAVGYYEAVTYAFAEREKLEKYGFNVVDTSINLVNPIVKELDTLRTTIAINLLESAKRNLNYGKKRIPLFEIGSVFDKNRKESEKLTLLWCGDAKESSVLNQGKPPKIDFALFVEKLGDIIGSFTLKPCSEKNRLIHPYSSADIFIDDKRVGWLSKLNIKAQEEFDLDVTYIAELDFEALIPEHKNASDISNFQGAFKDLSLLVDRELPYNKIDRVIKDIKEPLIRRFFPIDVYEDESLGDKKSVTIRFFLQSIDSNLSDEMIEEVMRVILETLEQSCEAKLR